MSLVEVGALLPPFVGVALGVEVAAVFEGFLLGWLFFCLFWSLPSRAGGRFLPDGLSVGLELVAPGLGGTVTPAPGEFDGGGSGGVVVPGLGGTWATRRNRSCACRTTVSTRLFLVGPGTWTT